VAFPIGYTWSYLACRTGHLVPVWQVDYLRGEGLPNELVCNVAYMAPCILGRQPPELGAVINYLKNRGITGGYRGTGHPFGSGRGAKPTRIVWLGAVIWVSFQQNLRCSMWMRERQCLVLGVAAADVVMPGMCGYAGHASGICHAISFAPLLWPLLRR
jgi:hypothetical protein